jgi:hypothetical protein
MKFKDAVGAIHALIKMNGSIWWSRRILCVLELCGGWELPKTSELQHNRGEGMCENAPIFKFNLSKCGIGKYWLWGKIWFQVYLHAWDGAPGGGDRTEVLIKAVVSKISSYWKRRKYCFYQKQQTLLDFAMAGPFVKYLNEFSFSSDFLWRVARALGAVSTGRQRAWCDLRKDKGWQRQDNGSETKLI